MSGLEYTLQAYIMGAERNAAATRVARSNGNKRR